MAPKSWFALAALTTLISAAPPAKAEGNARLAEAQKSYADVDYERTRTLARSALQQGGNDRAATGELYLLWAIAAAALDQAEESRTAFSYVLATNPDLKLERTLSPKIRAPYLEARGSASTSDGKPPLEVSLRRRNQELELSLRDTLHVAATIEVGIRSAESAPFDRRRIDATSIKRLPTPSGSELQFFLHVLDRYGNVLLELGTEDEPQRLALVSSGPSKLASAPNHVADASPTPYYVTAATLGGLGIAAGAVATVMFLRREDAARDWNGPGCERPGSTRQQQCAAVDSRRQQSEYLSIGFAATSGGLLVGGLVSLLLAPSPRASVAVDAGPGNLMLRLRTTL